MTPDLTLDNNATKIQIRLMTDIDYVTVIKGLGYMTITGYKRVRVHDYNRL